MTKKLWKIVKEWVPILLVAVFLAFIINKFIIYTVSPPTASMEDTILVGDRVITYRLAYLFSEPERGDIVVFQAPDSPDEDYMKRVIGLPGETIEGYGGVIYLDGVPLKENYLKEPMTESFGPIKIPKGCYFMMGDNRNISWDARYWTNKFVTKDKIRGKVLFKFYRKLEWLS